MATCVVVHLILVDPLPVALLTEIHYVLRPRIAANDQHDSADEDIVSVTISRALPKFHKARWALH